MSAAASLSPSHGYELILLRERSIVTRLDVGPFLIMYGFLVSLDFKEEEESTFSHVIFPFVLLMHLVLFLLQQWSVSWRVKVGYRKILSSSSKMLMSSTHCFVEAPHVEKHQSSHDDDIVSVEHRLLNYDTNKESNEVLLIVNFQDIVFRCNLSVEMGVIKYKDDADQFLWNLSEPNDSNETSSESVSLSSVPSFHRVRYPINLPLSFYNDWRGHKSMEQVVIAQQTYGTNSTPIQLPPFLDLLQQQVMAPFFFISDSLLLVVEFG